METFKKKAFLKQFSTILPESKGLTSVSFLDSMTVCGPTALGLLLMVGVGRGGQDKVGLVALTSPHIVPEMVFASTPLKCFRELDRARADIPEENTKGVDVDGIIILPCSEKRRWQ